MAGGGPVPAVGQRVRVTGLSGRAELNGNCGSVTGSTTNGRLLVKLDSTLEPVSLKPANLELADRPSGSGGPGGFGGMPGGFGGMPGMPGMPGGFGGMPGMPRGGAAGLAAAAQRGVVQMQDAVAQVLASLGIRLPPGVTLRHATLGLAVGAAVILYALTRFMSFTVLASVGAVAYATTMTRSGRETTERVAAQVSGACGRPVPPHFVVAGICALALYFGHSLLGGTRRVTAEPATDAYSIGLREAYQQGYDDSLAGLDPRPPKHIPGPDYGSAAAGSSGASSGFGLSSLIRYAMMAGYVQRLGVGPGGWSIQNSIANLRANPMMGMMILSMLSGSFF